MVWDVDREILSVGTFALRWYSLLFALGIVLGYFVLQSIFKREHRPLALLDTLLFYVVIGTVVGARLGHCLMYEPGEYLSHPLRIVKVWEGGLASHGGFTGVIVALMLFCRRHPQVSFFWLADRMTAPAMLAAGCIRLGNFFNSEIVGKPASVPWAIVFKRVDLVPRHPSQLYEAAGYFAVSAVMYGVYRVATSQARAGEGGGKGEGRLFGLVLILGYGFRLFIEALKENQVPFEDLLPLNMGQLLSIPFILIGVFFLCGGHYHVAFLRPGLSAAARGEPDEPGDLNLEAASVSRRGQLRRRSKKNHL